MQPFDESRDAKQAQDGPNNERIVLSVIARKIAFADKPDVDRPDAETLGHSLLVFIERALCVWLSVEEVQIELVRSEWAMRKADDIPGILISTRGSRRSRRIAMSMTENFAEMAAQDVLQLNASLGEEALITLRPFVEQNLLAFAGRINDTRIMAHAGREDPDWALDTIDSLQSDFGVYDVLSLEVAYLDGDGGDMRLVLMITSEMLAIGQEDDNNPVASPDTVKLPPRLGPCHVEVKAVADRVRMSVADCTRLEIGQVVSLPGLRFDHLELNVEMGDGPVPLTDASLGADKGFKAVRLNRGLDPDFKIKPEDMMGSSKTVPSGKPVPA